MITKYIANMRTAGHDRCADRVDLLRCLDRRRPARGRAGGRKARDCRWSGLIDAIGNRLIDARRPVPPRSNFVVHGGPRATSARRRRWGCQSDRESTWAAHSPSLAARPRRGESRRTRRARPAGPFRKAPGRRSARPRPDCSSSIGAESIRGGSPYPGDRPSEHCISAPPPRATRRDSLVRSMTAIVRGLVSTRLATKSWSRIDPPVSTGNSKTDDQERLGADRRGEFRRRDDPDFPKIRAQFAVSFRPDRARRFSRRCRAATGA